MGICQSSVNERIKEVSVDQKVDESTGIQCLGLQRKVISRIDPDKLRDVWTLRVRRRKWYDEEGLEYR